MMFSCGIYSQSRLFGFAMACLSIVSKCIPFGVFIWAGVLRLALNRDLLYRIFEYLICLPSREERSLLVIFTAVVI